MTQCLLWHVVIIDVDIALQGLRQVFPERKGLVARTSLMRPLNRSIMPLVWGWRGGKVAWRIYYPTLLGWMDPDAPCTLVFQEPEWQALYTWYHHTTVLPDQPPILQEATRWVAIKGGFQGRKADGHPGAEVLWHGLQKQDVAIKYVSHLPSCRAGELARRVSECVNENETPGCRN